MAASLWTVMMLLLPSLAGAAAAPICPEPNEVLNSAMSPDWARKEAESDAGQVIGYFHNMERATIHERTRVGKILAAREEDPQFLAVLESRDPEAAAWVRDPKRPASLPTGFQVQVERATKELDELYASRASLTPERIERIEAFVAKLKSDERLRKEIGKISSPDLKQWLEAYIASSKGGPIFFADQVADFFAHPESATWDQRGDLTQAYKKYKDNPIYVEYVKGRYPDVYQQTLKPGKTFSPDSPKIGEGAARRPMPKVAEAKAKPEPKALGLNELDVGENQVWAFWLKYHDLPYEGPHPRDGEEEAAKALKRLLDTGNANRLPADMRKEWGYTLGLKKK